MSLDQVAQAMHSAIEANTEALKQLTQALRGTAPVSVAPQVAPAAFAPPAAPLANGMPGGPFGTQATAPAAPPAFAPPAFAPPAFAPPAAPGAPFSDLKGCTDYATDSWQALEAKAPGRGEIVTQLITHLCGSGSINDLPAAAYPQFYTELEKKKKAL